MAYKDIIVETRGKVGLVTLNRPDVLNALNSNVISELLKALKGFAKDEKIGFQSVLPRIAIGAGRDRMGFIDDQRHVVAACQFS